MEVTGIPPAIKMMVLFVNNVVTVNKQYKYSSNTG